MVSQRKGSSTVLGDQGSDLITNSLEEGAVLGSGVVETGLGMLK